MSDVLELGLQDPVSVLSESELSPSDVAPPLAPVFYHYDETSDRSGVCVVHDDDGKLCWSPITVSKRAVKVGLVASSDDSDLDSNDCHSFDYQPRGGVPGFFVETNDDGFWAPIAHRTRRRLKSKSVGT